MLMEMALDGVMVRLTLVVTSLVSMPATVMTRIR